MLFHRRALLLRPRRTRSLLLHHSKSCLPRALPPIYKPETQLLLGDVRYQLGHSLRDGACGASSWAMALTDFVPFRNLDLHRAAAHAVYQKVATAILRKIPGSEGLNFTDEDARRLKNTKVPEP